MVSCISYTQHSISGTFSPAEDFSWLIAYRLKTGTQVYVVDTSIKDGNFKLDFPKDAIAGTYRLVYAVPQEEFYFDVLYNGKEDIELTFNMDQGVQFLTSQENILFNTYFNKFNELQQQLIGYYTKGTNNEEAYYQILNEYVNIQKDFEVKTEGLLANEFVKANKMYVPKEVESIQDYIGNIKASYFKYLDLKNPTLQASGYLTDKLANYVFTSLPLSEQTKQDTEKIMQENVDTVFKKLDGTTETYKFHVFYTLWTQSSGTQYNDLAEYIYTSYLKTSSEAANNKEILDNIAIYNRLRIGVKAPEIEWSKGKESKKLSTLDGYENYLLVFWSSTCGHCLKELPELHKTIGDYTKLKVIAIGLENDDFSWKLESEKLTHFEHVISLGKWTSTYAKLYDIQATPSYFILNKNKEIIAKPETYNAVLTALKD